MRILKVYKLIAVEEFFVYFCLAATLLAVFTAILLAPHLLPGFARRDRATAHFLQAVSAGGLLALAFLKLVAESLGLLGGDLLNVRLNWFEDGILGDSSIKITGEIYTPMLLCLAGCGVCFVLEQLQGRQQRCPTPPLHTHTHRHTQYTLRPSVIWEVRCPSEQ